MNRQYQVELFRSIVDYMIKEVPGITIATDIICGFSGETDEDHQETVKLLKEYQFPIVNISQYYPRKGTPGASMKRVDRSIVKSRSTEISNIFKEYMPYKNLLHTYQKVYISNETDGKHLVAHTKSYIKVLIPMIDINIGKWIDVYITDTARFHIVGEIVNKKSKKMNYIILVIIILIILYIIQKLN